MLRQLTLVTLALCLCSTLTLSARADLFGHWPLDDGEGDEARNLVPGGETGIIFDHDFDGLGDDFSVWVDDPDRGTVIGLGGNTAWVEAGNIPLMDLDNKFSWAFWARQPPDQASPSNDIIIGNRWDEAGADTVPREFIKFTPNRFEYHMNGGFANDMAYGESPSDIPSNDLWIHHSVVKEGDSLTYYRNGEMSNEGVIPEGMSSADPLPFALGGQDGRETWRGYLSDVQLYESALSQDNVQSVMTGATVNNADLFGHWRLDDGNDSDEAADSGPRGESGIIADHDIGGLGDNGSVWFDDPDRGTVLSLAGDGAWVSAGDLPIMDLDNDFTWNFWARQDPGQASPANDVIIGNRWGADGADTVPREFIKFTPDRFEFHMNGAGDGDLQYAEGDAVHIPSNDQWLHHTVVKDEDQLAYYRNGTLQNTHTLVDPMFSPDELPFGMGGQNGAETWQGYLSDVRLYDHALTQAEIDELVGKDPALGGDYNGDGVVDAVDADLLADAQLSGDPDLATFDENGDGMVDNSDRLIWTHDHAGTWVGDSNLDLEFNSGDLVFVFGGGKYETGEEAGYEQGDWDGNKLFNSSDLVAAFGDGGYEQGPRGVAPVAVPEPSGIVLLLLGGMMMLVKRRK